MAEKSNCKASQTCVLITVFIAFFITAFSTYTTVISAKRISIELHMDAVMLSWVSTIFILAAAMLQIPFGKIGDIYGRKKVFLVGTILFTFSSFFLGLSDSSLMFIIFRFAQGSGAALIFATANAILSSSYSPKERGKALGLSVTGVYLGLTLSPVLGGIMTEHIGWRCQFWFIIPFGILILFLGVFKMKDEGANEKKEKFDYFGTIIFLIFVFSLIYSISFFPDSSSFVFLSLFIIGAFVFFIWEKRNSQPLLDLNLFKNNRFLTLSSVSELIFYISTIALNLLLSLYMQYIKNMTAQEAGYILVAQPLMMALFSPIAGNISGKIEAKKITSFGIGISSIGILVLIFIDSNFPVLLIALAFAIIGVGTAFFASPNIRAIMSSVPKDSLGVAAGLEGTMRTIGQSLSFGTVTIVFSLLIGEVEITPDYYSLFLGSSRLICTIFFLMAILSLIVSLLRGKARNFE